MAGPGNRFLFHFFYAYKMKTKLLMTYSLVVIIPIVVMGIFLTFSIYSMTVTDKTNTANIALNQTKENMLSKLDWQKGVIDKLLSNKYLMGYIDTYYENNFISLSDYEERVQPIFNQLDTSGIGYVLKIFSRNSTIRFSGITNNTLDDLAGEPWYADPGTGQDICYWTGLYNMYSNQTAYSIGCYRILHEPGAENRVHAVIAVFIREQDLYSLISEQRQGRNVIFLFDGMGRIVTTTERGRLEQSSADIYRDAGSLKDARNGDVVLYLGKRYIYNAITIDDKPSFIDDWKMVYLTPSDELFAAISKVWLTSLALAVISVFLSFIIILVVTKSFNRRISMLLANMKKVFDGDTTVRIDAMGSDELGELQNQFNNMVGRLDTLIHEVYEAKMNLQETEIRRRKAETLQKSFELEALQRQINPHYLINTLETIRMNLVKKEDRETARIVKIFADTFRILVYDRKKMHTLKEELEFVDMYMTIQNYRHFNKISLQHDISRELTGVLLPKLLIQPIIENAIIHGLKEKDGEGRIEITAQAGADSIRINVTDNGVGIDEGKLKLLRGQIDAAPDTDESMDSYLGVALKNIAGRLRLEYGGGYRLEIKSRAGFGTTVSVSVPRRPQAPDGGGSEG